MALYACARMSKLQLCIINERPVDGTEAVF